MAALDDLAAALGMDPLDLFERNLSHVAPRLEPIYRRSSEIADGAWGGAALGTGVGRWGRATSAAAWACPSTPGAAAAIAATATLTVHPDGGAEAKLGTQDLGTGTRTVIAIVLAETLGLRPLDVTVRIGDSRPTRRPAAPGGSTTVGGVSPPPGGRPRTPWRSSSRRSPRSSRRTPDELEAADGRIRVADDPSRSLSWKEATAKLGVTPIAVTGAEPGPRELTDSGVGGVQMAEVAVDVETGIVRVEQACWRSRTAAW
jgi:xanthine dehydrogenase YagR molybdenum-binding subunit